MSETGTASGQFCPPSDFRIEPTFGRQVKTHAVSDTIPHREAPSRASRHTAATRSSNTTWVSIPRHHIDPPPLPSGRGRGYPSVANSRNEDNDDDDPDLEIMNLDQDAMPAPVEAAPLDSAKRKGSAMRFVGGFVSSVRNLPRVMVRAGRSSGQAAPHPGGTESTGVMPPDYEQPGLDPASVQIVEAVEMPIVHPAVSPRPSHLSSHLQGSTSNSVSYSFTPQREFEPIMHEEAFAVQDGTQPHDETETRVIHGTRSTRASGSRGGSHHMDSPIFSPTSDYDKMPTPPKTPPAPSLNSYFSRFNSFLNDLNKLPWVASSTDRVAADYVPHDNPRSRYRAPQYRRADKTWYTSRRRDVDLLGEPNLSRITSSAAHNSHGSNHTSTQVSRRSRPRSQSCHHSPPCSRVATPSPHSPSHSHTVYMEPRPFAQLSYPYGYSPSPPQPLYVFPPTPPQSPGQHTQPGEGIAMHQAMPLYLVAGIPSFPPGYAQRSGVPDEQPGSGSASTSHDANPAHNLQRSCSGRPISRPINT